jgi:hypothetical protein
LLRIPVIPVGIFVSSKIKFSARNEWFLNWRGRLQKKEKLDLAHMKEYSNLQLNRQFGLLLRVWEKNDLVRARENDIDDLQRQVEDLKSDNSKLTESIEERDEEIRKRDTEITGLHDLLEKKEKELQAMRKKAPEVFADRYFDAFKQAAENRDRAMSFLKHADPVNYGQLLAEFEANDPFSKLLEDSQETGSGEAGSLDLRFAEKTPPIPHYPPISRSVSSQDRPRSSSVQASVGAPLVVVPFRFRGGPSNSAQNIAGSSQDLSRSRQEHRYGHFPKKPQSQSKNNGRK